MSNAPIQVSTTSPLPGATLVNQLNAALLALGSDFSGPDDPGANAPPYSRWADSGTGRWRLRNGAGTAWIDLGPLAAEAAEPIDGALLASQAWVQKKLGAILPGLPIFDGGSIPAENLGPIFGVGKGVMAWNGSAYVPNNLPTRFRDGGTLTPGATNVAVAPGRWRSADDTVDIILAATLTKNLQTAGAWAAGNNQNGLFSGVRTTDTWYHVYAIQRTATGAVDVGFSTSYPPADLPSGWDKWRRLGSVYTTGTNNILGYLQVGRFFVWPNVRPTVSSATVSNQQLLNMDVPPDVRVRGQFTILQEGGSSFPHLLLVSPEVSASVSSGFADYLRAGSYNAYAKTEVITNTSRQIRALTTSASITNLDIGTQGWEDFLED